MHYSSPIPAPPQTQALASSTFKPPPLDGSLSLVETYEWHAEHTPNHRVFVFNKADGTTRTIYWPEVVAAVRTGAKLIHKNFVLAPSKKTQVVAILSLADNLTYFMTMMSILRANLVCFAISPRNSAVAVAHLFAKTNVEHVLVSRDLPMQTLFKDAIEILAKDYPDISPPTMATAPLFDDLFYPPASIIEEPDIPLKTFDADEIVFYFHSSGSTAFPKPIPWTHYRFAQCLLIPWFGEQDICDKILALHVMPMFHGMGALQLGWTASAGLVLAAFEPKYPAIPPTPENFFESAKSSNSDIIFCVPSFVEAWSRQPAYVEWLATRTGVLYGGGPLNKKVGNEMTAKGVSVYILYGATEVGVMSPIIPAKSGMDWDHFFFTKQMVVHMKPCGGDTFELVLVANKYHTPSIINTKIDGVPAYATSDLLVPHPSQPGKWRIFGRTDDQIMHSTGEKTNPGPLENIMNQDPHVTASVMFGRGKFQAGILVEPKPTFKFDPTNENLLADFRSKIWPTVERMNEFAPQHSRLFKEMIIVASPSKPFTYTAKHTVRRLAVLRDYDNEIETLYNIVNESAQSAIPSPSHWDETSIREFVHKVVVKVLPAAAELKDVDDIFQHGCDSLQATWIRNSLLRAVRDDAGIDTRKLTSNFVYNYPSINQLSIFITSLVLSGSDGIVEISRVQAMRDLLLKYSSTSYPISKPNANQGKTILLLGSTGGLGCQILVQLLADPTVSKVYAIVRGNDLKERQIAAFREREIDIGVLENTDDKLTFLNEFARLSPEVLADLRTQVTHIINSAWRVDFNLGLSSFEFNIQDLRRLIDFAIETGSLLIYTSSISVIHNIHSPSVSEEPVDPEAAVGIGYAESKWVSEELLRDAQTKAGLKYVAIRVGQLCGASDTGAWNTTEWVPSMVQASIQLIKSLPADQKDISWLPIDIAASAVLDLLTSDILPSVTHLVHPLPVQWSEIAREIGLPLVPGEDWVNALEKNPNDKMKATQLIPFFRNVLTAKANSVEAFGFAHLGMEKMLSVSKVLSDPALPKLDGRSVKAWLGYWTRKGLL